MTRSLAVQPPAEKAAIGRKTACPGAKGPGASAIAIGAIALAAAVAAVSPGRLTAQTAATGAGASEPGDWWRSTVCYEVFVRSFQDSDGDGVGDLRGLIDRLDYINDGDPATSDDLGAGCIWLMPVNESPSYHGYDVTNYFAVNRDYGTEADFRRLADEAHRRGIRILFDLVLNHTSSEHPWFRQALLDPASAYHDWYRWAPAPQPSPGWQAPTWHRNPYRDEFYYGLFWSGMPDLDLANPAVTAEAGRIARFWLDSMGVDGFRLDAVAHFFEGADGEWKSVPAVHPWLRDYQDALEAMDPAVFTVGEVMDSIGAILEYYPDQLDSYFMFGLSDAILGAVRSGSKSTLEAQVGRLERTIPDHRYATLLRNHDQTRTMTDLHGDEPRARLAATLLLTLPGFPFVYYGEELGMTGDKRRGDIRLRTPMPWATRPGLGFTSAMPWEPPHPDSLTANVEAQSDEPGSLLNHYRALIHLRTGSAALGRGDFLPLDTGSDTVMAFVRRAGDETALVVANLGSRPLESVRLTLPAEAMAPGRYTISPLLGAGNAARVSVGADGRVAGRFPAGGVGGLEAVVFRVDPEG